MHTRHLQLYTTSTSHVQSLPLNSRQRKSPPMKRGRQMWNVLEGWATAIQRRAPTMHSGQTDAARVSRSGLLASLITEPSDGQNTAPRRRRRHSSRPLRRRPRRRMLAPHSRSRSRPGTGPSVAGGNRPGMRRFCGRGGLPAGW
jgi:hypothetical protein